MDENPQTQLPPDLPPAPKKSFFGSSSAAALITGAISGAIATVVANLILKKPTTLKNTLKYTGLMGGATLLLHWATRKPVPAAPIDTPQTDTPPPALPPTPPAATPAPQGLALATVPQILDILVAKGELTAEQQTKLIADIQQGRAGFAGELAVADGMITKPQLDTALADQAARKAEAAIADINAIAEHGPITNTASWLMANWGNNGVNPPAANPSRVEGAVAAANVAQNLVLLANTAPPQMLPVISKGVLAAAYLSRGIAQGDSATVPLEKLGNAWRETMDNALILAVQANPASPHSPRDSNGKPVDIYDYVAARNAEVSAGVAQALQQPPEQQIGHGR